MSLEFSIEFSCAVRRRLNEQQLRELARIASINARFVEMSINATTPPTEEMMQFMDQSMAKLRQLDEITPICRSCPANFLNQISNKTSESVGCLGRINYPIDGSFEHFLANRFQLILDTEEADDWPRAMSVLIDRESPFDGEGTKALRCVTTSEGLRFFALRTPIPLHRKGAHITTDNIFDLLAGFTNTDNGSSGYARELPVIALADYCELLDVIFGNDISMMEKERLLVNSVSYSQYCHYIEAIKRAEELQVRLLID